VSAFYKMNDMSKVFANAKVLVTGHTGFKGSWLVAWLLKLGAKVVGLSNNIPTEPSHFVAAQLQKQIHHCTVDLQDLESVIAVVREAQPDFVFHLAAQALVRRSYADPLLTFHTNALGTAHLLEALRKISKPCVGILITSDKCYDNVEWVWGYRETDRLGGKDPYSASKGAAELIIRSYVESFLREGSPIRVAVGRAGNVIGGGDWAEDRIVPDCMRAWNKGKQVSIRNPLATRPWQHVLEPLSGYLALACALAESPTLHGEAFNFGPRAEQNYSVRALLDALAAHWPGALWQDISQTCDTVHEAGLLKLNCDKALHKLQWQPTLDFSETVQLTAQWYRTFYADPSTPVLETTLMQLQTYFDAARRKDMPWAR
jgi:CDP-glucose 4,6-dehydratase